MTGAMREAVVLPAAFLTVLLLGSVRMAQSTVLAPPSVFALVLGLLLVRVVVQSGALAPERLMAASRSPMANLNGDRPFRPVAGSGAGSGGAHSRAGLPRIVFAVFLRSCSSIRLQPRRIGSASCAAWRSRSARSSC